MVIVACLSIYIIIKIIWEIWCPWWQNSLPSVSYWVLGNQWYKNILSIERILYTQQKRDVVTTLFYCWATVFDAGPTIKQRCGNMSCLLYIKSANTIWWVRIGKLNQHWNGIGKYFSGNVFAKAKTAPSWIVLNTVKCTVFTGMSP